MLSEREKKEFSERLKKLKEDQDKLRKSLSREKPSPESAEKFKPLGIVYEFIAMIIAVSFVGYYAAKLTNTLPWTMIVIILSGYAYAFIRLYKSVTKHNP